MNDTPTSPDIPTMDEIAALRAIVEGTARHTGQEFFQSLVRHLAAAGGTRYAFGAELERLHFEKQLRESEEQYRDLFEEAPIGYIKQDLESRFITANRAALRILGLKPEEAAGTVGMSFVADTPDAQRRIREAFASAGRGTDTGGVVLELRRKDGGRPVWVQWWSRPEPNGKYTRTVIVDITERVLMEQEKARLQQQNLYLQEEIKSVHNFEEIIGQSSSLTAVLDDVRRVAATDATVLITRDTRTRKELIRRAVLSSSL